MSTTDTLDQLRALLSAVPFVPFTVRLADGCSFVADRPDDVSLVTVVGQPMHQSFWLHDELVLVADVTAIEPGAGKDGA